MSDSKESGGWFALGMMLGAAVGAAIGLLYAPRPGAETRHDLAEKSDELRQRAAEAGAGLEERSSALIEQVRPTDELTDEAGEPAVAAGDGESTPDTVARGEESGPDPDADTALL